MTESTESVADEGYDELYDDTPSPWRTRLVSLAWIISFLFAFYACGQVVQHNEYTLAQSDYRARVAEVQADRLLRENVLLREQIAALHATPTTVAPVPTLPPPAPSSDVVVSPSRIILRSPSRTTTRRSTPTRRTTTTSCPRLPNGRCKPTSGKGR